MTLLVMGDRRRPSGGLEQQQRWFETWIPVQTKTELSLQIWCLNVYDLGFMKDVLRTESSINFVATALLCLLFQQFEFSG